MLITLFVAALLLLGASAFFSGSETALLKLSKIKVKRWIYLRSANSEAWINWLSRPQELIVTILIGNTLVNIFFSALTALIAMHLLVQQKAEWIQALAGGVAFILVLLFGEIVPKIFSMQNAERVSSLALPPLYRLSQWLGVPAKKSLNLLGKGFKIFQEPPPGRVSTLTLDEMRLILKDTTSLQGLSREQQEMMQKVLELHNTTVEKIMTRWDKVEYLILDEALSGGKDLERFIDRLIESGRTRLPVIKKETAWISHQQFSYVIGYLFINDLLSQISTEQKIDPTFFYKKIRRMPVLNPEKKIGELLDIFRYGSPIACVQNRLGFPLGIVTLEDVMEEIVGEILDEYDIK